MTLLSLVHNQEELWRRHGFSEASYYAWRNKLGSTHETENIARQDHRAVGALGLAPNAIVGARMRTLVHLNYGVIKSGRPFQADIPLAGLEIKEGI